MLARITSYGLTGLLGYPVTVETDISFGFAGYETVGLPDNAVKESKERVRYAICNSGFPFPNVRLVVNLAPADVRKEGTVYDLPIAIGILAANGDIDRTAAEKWLIIGELALDGSVRGVNGVLPMVIDACSRGYNHIIPPKGKRGGSCFHTRCSRDSCNESYRGCAFPARNEDHQSAAVQSNKYRRPSEF